MNEVFSLEGKVAIVTGAARGNGRTIAEAYLGAGAVVCFVDVLAEEIGKLKTQKPGNPGARFVVADVTDSPSMETIIKGIYQQEGSIDVLVNNAGVGFSEPSLTYSEEKWETTYAVNLKAPFMVSQIAARYMKEQGGGVIINVTSICAELGFPDNPAYVAFKGGL